MPSCSRVLKYQSPNQRWAFHSHLAEGYDRTPKTYISPATHIGITHQAIEIEAKIQRQTQTEGGEKALEAMVSENEGKNGSICLGNWRLVHLALGDAKQ